MLRLQRVPADFWSGVTSPEIRRVLRMKNCFLAGLGAGHAAAMGRWRLRARAREERVTLLVLKFGGTSVADIDCIRNVARHVKREYNAGHDVAVVVSAMAGKTNELVGWCRDASPMHAAREYDA